MSVTKAYMFGNSGGVHEIKDADSECGRRLVPVGKIVGYLVKNSGKKGILFTNTKYIKNPNGSYTKEKFSDCINVGEEKILNKDALYDLSLKIEFCKQFANGRMRCRRLKWSSKEINPMFVLFKGSIYDEGFIECISKSTKNGDVLKKKYIEAFGWLESADSIVHKSKKSHAEFYKMGDSVLESTEINTLINKIDEKVDSYINSYKDDKKKLSLNKLSDEYRLTYRKLSVAAECITMNMIKGALI